MANKLRPGDHPSSTAAPPASAHGEMSEAIFLTQGFAYESMEQAEAPLSGAGARLHLRALFQPDDGDVRGAHGRCWKAPRRRAPRRAAWAAVMAAVMGQVRAGDHVVAARALFGSCLYIIEDLLPALRRRDHRWSTAATSASGARRCARRTKVLFLEDADQSDAGGLRTSPPSPRSRTRAAPPASSTTCSRRPMLQRPLELGADVVVYSATKHVDGHGRCLGGVILSSKAFIDEHLHNFLRHTGPAMSPVSTPGCC